MSYIPLEGSNPIALEPEPLEVECWDPWMRKRVYPSNGMILNVEEVQWGNSEFPGSALIMKTGPAFHADYPDDEDILIGCYVRINRAGETIWVGTILNLREHLSGPQKTLGIYYTARDMFTAVADKSMKQEFPNGIASGAVFGVIAGGLYIARNTTPGSPSDTYTLTKYDPPLLPLDHRQRPLLDISPSLINAGAETIPREFIGEDIKTIMEDMSAEQRVDYLDVMPYTDRSGSSSNVHELGMIVGRNYSDDYKTVVIGAQGWNEVDLFPVVTDIYLNHSYEGVITQVIAWGGDIFQRSFSRLFPAWNRSLDDAVLNNEQLGYSEESDYGPVGKLLFRFRRRNKVRSDLRPRWFGPRI